MGKIVIIGDTHFGGRNNSINYHAYFEKFYADLFQYIDTHDIKCILQTGDLFDNRKSISTWSLDFFYRVFVKEVLKRDIKVYITVGNHCLFYKDSLEIHTPGLVLREYKDNFTVIDSPQDFNI